LSSRKNNFSMKRNKRILVIGGLAAGPAAAAKAKRVDPHAEVVLFERTHYISYGICEIPYYLTGEYTSKNRLVVYSPDRMQREKRVHVNTRTVVEAIDRVKKTVHVRDLREKVRRKEEYDKLIITAGSMPRVLPFMNGPLKNVFTIKELGRAYELHDYLAHDRPKRAVIIGGGYIGLEMTEALRRLNVEVTLIHRHQYPLSRMGEKYGKLIVEGLHKNGVHFVPRTEVKSFGRDGDYLRTVVTDEGTFDADLVIVAIGVVPNAGLAQEAGIEIGQLGGIKTDERQRTNDDSVYAAGDCCEIKNLITRRPTYIPLATIAGKTARTAGENAAGGNSVFKGAIRNIALRVFDCEVARVGLNIVDAEEAGITVVSETIEAPSRVGGMPGAAPVTITLIADKTTGKLLGAMLLGKDGVAHRGNVLAAMIQMGATIGDITNLDLMYAPPFSPLWDPILIAANQTMKKL
jgi:CoA-dependent NAD(P)H sulfur oxidoreductase